jgi:hypothetical protein
MFQDIQDEIAQSLKTQDWWTHVEGGLYCRRHEGSLYVHCHCLHVLHCGTRKYVTRVYFSFHLQRPAP